MDLDSVSVHKYAKKILPIPNSLFEVKGSMMPCCNWLALTHIISVTLKDFSASSQPHILHVPDFDDFISPCTEKTMTFWDHWPDGSTMTPEK